MNLYNFHSEPKSLIHHDEAHEFVPELFVDTRYGSVRFPQELSNTQLGALSRVPKLAYYYAKNVLKRRWPEAEPYIMKDPVSAYLYTKAVIDGPWPEAEKYILQHANTALAYATNILRKRWPEAEAILKTNDDLWVAYVDHFDLLWKL
jgi:lambda repressor-like predicted transcriptional regulator